MQLLDIDRRCVDIRFTPEELKFIAEACYDAAETLSTRRPVPGKQDNGLMRSWCETTAVGFEAASLAAAIYSCGHPQDLELMNLKNLRSGKLLDPI